MVARQDPPDSGQAQKPELVHLEEDEENTHGDEGVAEAVISELFESLRGLHHDAALGLAIRVAERVIEVLFGGDVDAWRSRGHKDVSLRKLARRFDAEKGSGFSAAGLYRLLALYELELRVRLTDRPTLTASHGYAVLGLPEEVQKELIYKADERGWTTRKLEHEAQEERRKAEQNGQVTRSGRPRLPAIIKTTNRLTKLVADANAFADLEALDAKSRERALEQLDALQARLTEVARSLRGEQ